MTISSTLPPGVTCSDHRWQSGYEAGFEDDHPWSDDPVYIAGWLTGYMGADQCGEADAVARYREHAVPWHTLSQRVPARASLGEPEGLSEACEVKNGDRRAFARYLPGIGGSYEDMNAPNMREEAWIGEDGKPLSWEPTHWRPAPI
ncbi:hypothetical protein [Methylobacterium gnaphalii]|uniref:Uncharacterized protein n=1 Tax=Methylobacterium gnaphalii TaxID=1010610 RepID=A0A512JP81_9HYPH|nr:hypothetical protein [Methylobacterium gnaphalii]GEP11770.1 hypothetical protein MGN01_36150 [Methylobacterium gnaphalii]GJD69446.1 hypothetical protein MMMDOFMJ_2377 [Methylobacterium gnaphalii]GLS49595.1 hypothetical protein GCM10007885_24440 [Methylobacterium gnaphalii]